MKKLGIGGTVSMLVLTMLLLAPGPAPAADGLSGRQILDQVAERHERPYEMEVQRMALISRGGGEEQREVKRYARKGEDGEYKYLVVFHAPSGIRGVALLTWQQSLGDDDQWLYMPAHGRQMRRIAKGGRRNYFMGTDYAFEDLVFEPREKFTYERLADETLDGVEHFVVKTTPSDEELQKESGYQYRQMWIRKDIFFVTRTDYYDRRGRFLKRQTNEDLVQVDDGKTWRANRSVMDNESTGRQTVIEVLERDFAESAVPEEIFTQRFVTGGRHLR